MADFYRCPMKCREEKTEHEFLEERGDYNEVYLVRCKSCGHEHEVLRKLWLFSQVHEEIGSPKKAYLTKYPRIEPHTGQRVKSKEHELETVRRMGYYPVKGS